MTYEEYFDIEPTFEEIVKKYGNEEIYKNTNVDEATKQILENYFFDYEIGADEKTFLRYYRRRLNEYYDQYIAEIRTLTIINNMDPYVQNYLEEKTLTGRTYDKTRNSENTSTGTGNTTGTTTPNLTTTTTITGTEKTEGTSGNTEIRNLTSESEGNTSGTSEINSKGRNFGISYPEANLNEISTNIDDMPSINYANSEQDSLAKSNTTNSTNDKSTTKDSGNVKNEGTNNSTLTHDVTNQQTQTGNSQTSTQSESNNKTNVNDKENGNDTSKFERIEKGRNESVVDIIPRVITSIEMTDPTRYFIEKMSICFNTISV